MFDMDFDQIPHDNKQPRPDLINEMTRSWREIHEANSVKIDMEATLVEEHTCGTVCCHAGAFLLHQHKTVGLGVFVLEEDTTKILSLKEDGHTVNWDYQYGVDAMAKFLFPKKKKYHTRRRFESGGIVHWAAKYPKIWGNKHGDIMFDEDGAKAFGKKKNSPITLLEIADWWDAVADRVRMHILANAILQVA